jgi:hypothetical protein
MGDGMDIKADTLSEALKMIMVKRKVSTRDIAAELNSNASTVWRAIEHPSRASGITLMALVKWSGISFDEFEKLFNEELKRNDKYR